MSETVEVSRSALLEIHRLLWAAQTAGGSGWHNRQLEATADARELVSDQLPVEEGDK